MNLVFVIIVIFLPIIINFMWNIVRELALKYLVSYLDLKQMELTAS